MRIRIFSLRIDIFTRKGRVSETLPRWGWWHDRMDASRFNNLYLGPISMVIDWIPETEPMNWAFPDDEDPMQQPWLDAN